MIHWTTFQFPPKKVKKLNDILSTSACESQLNQTKASAEAIQKLQEKATTCGLFKTKKTNYFYHPDDQLEAIEKSLFKQPESISRFINKNTAHRSKSNKRVLSKIENITIKEKGIALKNRSRLLSDCTMKSKGKSKYTQRVSDFATNQDSYVDDYMTRVAPSIRNGEKSLYKLSHNKVNRNIDYIHNDSLNSMYASTENPLCRFSIEDTSFDKSDYLNHSSTTKKQYCRSNSKNLTSSIQKLDKSAKRKLSMERRQRSQDRLLKTPNLCPYKTNNLRK